MYDKSIKEKLGSKNAVIAYWNDAMPHLQVRYCHETLGTQIRVERVGGFEYLDQKIHASGDNLMKIKSNAKDNIAKANADLVVYIANDENSLYGTIGIAWSPVVCEPFWYNDLKTSINEWRPNSISFGGVIQIILNTIIIKNVYHYKILFHYFS